MSASAWKWFNPVLILIFLGVTAAILILYPNEILYDQYAIRHIFSFEHFPKIVNGLGLNLFVGIYNRIIAPDFATIDSHMRIVTMLFFSVPSLLLGRLWLGDTRYFTVFILTFFGSRFPMLWLCVEQIAGGALLWFMYCYFSGRKIWITQFCLFFYGIVKPEMIFGAVLLLGWIVWNEKDRKKRIEMLAWFGGFHGVLHLTGVATYGLDYFVSSGQRAYDAVIQHYSDLFFKHQVGEGVPVPFDQAGDWRDKMFPEAHSVLTFLWHYPSHYMDFVALSFARGIKRVLVLMHLFCLLFPIRWSVLRFYGIGLSRQEKMVCVSLLGLLPIVLLAFPHIRYLTRFYPAALAAVILFWKISLEHQDLRVRRVGVVLVTPVILLGSMVTLILYFQDILHLGTHQGLYWFPD